jgi:hypothetical protein
MSEHYERYSLPGQREWLRKRRIKSFLLGFIIAAFIFTGLGYSLRMKQIDGPHKEEIASLNTKIDHYRNYWTPIKSKEVKKKENKHEKKGD